MLMMQTIICLVTGMTICLTTEDMTTCLTIIEDMITCSTMIEDMITDMTTGDIINIHTVTGMEGAKIQYGGYFGHFSSYN